MGAPVAGRVGQSGLSSLLALGCAPQCLLHLFRWAELESARLLRFFSDVYVFMFTLLARWDRDVRDLPSVGPFLKDNSHSGLDQAEARRRGSVRVSHEDGRDQLL